MLDKLKICFAIVRGSGKIIRNEYKSEICSDLKSKIKEHCISASNQTIELNEFHSLPISLDFLKKKY